MMQEIFRFTENVFKYSSSICIMHYFYTLDGSLSIEGSWEMKCGTKGVKKMYEAFRTIIVLISFKDNYNCISYITQRYNKSLMLI